MRRLQFYARALWMRLRYPLSLFFSTAALVVGLLGGIVALSPLFGADRTTQGILQSAALALIALLAFGTLAYREASFRRRRMLNETAMRRHSATALILQLYNFLTVSLQRIRSQRAPDANALARARALVADIIDEYSYVFSQLAATRCRMCVKMITEVNGEPYVYTLARDKISARENQPHDEQRERHLRDKLADNTDFAELWDPESPDAGFFFHHDIKNDHTYRSTSINYWQNVAGDPNRRSDRWLLPYRSTIVWPIRSEASAELGLAEERCVGYLAVDARIPYAFDREIDTFVGHTLARQLYPPLELYTELDREMKEREQNEQ